MKKFLLRVCSVITCIIVLIVCCLPAGAVDQDLIDQGWIYDEDSDSYFLPLERDPAQYFPAPLLLSSPKYPNFNPVNLPWYDAPKAVTDVINMGLDKATTPDNAAYQMPFVAMRVNSSGVDVYVGINVLLGTSSTFTVRPISPLENFPSMSTSFCYYARFSHDYKVKTDWQKCTTYAWGDSVAYCSATFIDTDYNIDVYVYGGNGLHNNSTTPPRTGTIQFDGRTAYVDNRIGFDSGQILYGYATGEYPSIYVATFEPPTYEDQEKQKDKNLLDTIKNIPTTIKTFFTSLGDKIGGFFENLVGNLQTFFNTVINSIFTAIEDLFANITDHFSTDDPGELDESKSDELDDIESDVFDESSNYNPDNFKNDFQINLDGKAIGAVFAMIDSFVQLDNEVYAGILAVLVLGVIALIFNR